MNTGQLFMQIPANTAADFVKTATKSVSAISGVGEKSGFEGVLRGTASRSFSRSEQNVKTEPKKAAVQASASLEKSQDDNRTVFAGKSAENVEKHQKEVLCDAVSGQAAEKEESKSEETIEPQNVETIAVFVPSAVIRTADEGRMPVQEPNADRSPDIVNAAVTSVENVPVVEASVAPVSVEAVKQPEEPVRKNQVSDAGAVVSMTDAKSENMVAQKPEIPPIQAEQQKTGSEPISEKKGNAELPVDFKKMKVEVEQTMKSEPVATVQAEGMADTVNKTTDIFAKQAVSVMSGDERKTDVATPANAQPKVDVSGQAAAVSVQTEKKQPQPNPVGFRFARTVAVEAEAGTGRTSAVDQTSGNVSQTSAASVENSVGENASPGGKGSTFSSGREQQDASLQRQGDTARPVFQNLSSSFAVNTASVASEAQSSASVQDLSVTAGENIAGQVKAQLADRNIKPGAEELTIKLAPEHLGEIKVSFRLENQQLKVEIVAENRTARESLLQHADSLKESLARQNINMEKFEVTGGNSGSANQGNNPQPEWREMLKNRQAQQWQTGSYSVNYNETAPAVPLYFAKAENSTLDLHF